MAPEYGNFVGRERELIAFRRVLKNPYGKIRILFILGDGGTGKTLLVKEMLREARKSGALVAEEPIDLFSTDYRHIDGIQWKIKEIIENLPGLVGKPNPFADFVKGKTDRILCDSFTGAGL
jgi:Cdc6-like AAA superfamily ATPase